MNILITGGANGLGAEITKLLASNSEHFVYFTYAKSAEKAGLIENAYKNTKAIKCDFLDLNDIEALVLEVENYKIDVLINNAHVGEAINKHIHKTKNEDFIGSYIANIAPVISITNAAILFFRKNGGGKIITVLTSFLEGLPPAGTAVYLSTKAILLQLSKSWATENIKYNISANCVSPSFMITDFTNKTDERIIEEITNQHPLKKLLLPLEVAEVINMLTKATTQLNNQNIVINAS